jgi:DNA-binding MarR family transcriptional regulator
LQLADYKHMQITSSEERDAMAVEDLTIGLGKESRCSCTALRKASRRISQLYDVALLPCGLTVNQRSVMAQVSRALPVTVGKLAESLVMDPGALAHTLKPLERDGLVEVRVDPTDRRQRLIALTPAGEASLAEAEALWANAQQSFEAALGIAESDAMRGELSVLVSNEFLEAFQSALHAQQGRRDPQRR